MMTLEQALLGQEIPPNIRETLVLLDLDYWGFDDAQHTGQMVVNGALAAEVRAIFAEIYNARFPIEQMVPVAAFGWSDDASMAANNASAFNYRLAVGQPWLSQHAFGRAIDINPRQNPYLKGDLVLPAGAVYDPDARGTLVSNGAAVKAFERRGWDWGGHWTTLKDWHHFQKQAAN